MVDLEDVVDYSINLVDSSFSNWWIVEYISKMLIEG